MDIVRILDRPASSVPTAATRQWLSGKTVLVTGAGGSIGSEIVRQVRALNPGRVVMLDHDEGALHALQLESEGHGLLVDDNIVLADIRDQLVIYDLFDHYRPDVVFHAAAHKHLPLMERFPAEGIKTNVLGTWNVARAAARCGVRTLVNISTDKAAAPACVLGMTKRLAESLCASVADAELSVASVRFGNVLGSRGSFLPTLHYQLTHGIAVTVTDPNATRYFMTIPEAAGLVLEAGLMAGTGETFVLDMGEPVRILDVVTRYCDQLGVDPEIVVTGLRPGEKLHEVLAGHDEVRVPTAHPRISVIHARTPPATHRLGVAVERLERRIGITSAKRLIGLLATLLPIDADGAAA